MNQKTSFFMALVAFAMSLATTVVLFKHIDDCSEKDNVPEVQSTIFTKDNAFVAQSEVFTKDAALVKYQILYRIPKEDLEWFSEAQMSAEKCIQKILAYYIGDIAYEEFCDKNVRQAHERVIYEQLRFASTFAEVAIDKVVLQPCSKIADNFTEEL